MQLQEQFSSFHRPKNLCTLLSCPMLNQTIVLFSALKYPLNKCQPQAIIGHLIQIALAKCNG